MTGTGRRRSLSIVVLIRRCRPYLSALGLVGWVSYRLKRRFTSADWSQDRSILDFLLLFIQQCREKVWTRIIEFQSSQQSLGSEALLATIAFSFQILHDIFGIFVLLGSLRLIYVVYHFSWPEFNVALEDSIFEWSKAHITMVSRELEKETEKIIPDAKKSFGREEFEKQNQLLELPKKGRPTKDIFKELSDYSIREAENWNTGKISGTVYTLDEDHIKFMNDVYGLYSLANTLHPGVWPKLTQCEVELISMTSKLLHGNGIGSTTSGGTESIMLAIKAHWIYYGKNRSITNPELICGSTVHAAVDKACEIFGIRKVTIDCNDPTNHYTLCPNKVRKRVTSNTIMIVASAPNYPQGTIDPIEALGSIAEEYDIGLHVDSCLGGFVLGFAPERFPIFDFRVPGVTSMSADTHKFGYTAKGTSVVLYKTKELRHAQYFSYARWTGGFYVTPTFAGSRPSSLVGCAWAAMVSIGYDGYRERTLQILNASRLICEGVKKDIPELNVMGQAEPTMVVSLDSTQVDIYRVCDLMTSKGWHLNSLQNPASIHVCVTLALAPMAEQLVRDLKEAVALVRKEDPLNSKKQGTAAIYGMTGSLPDGPVNDLLKAFLDVGLTA